VAATLDWDVTVVDPRPDYAARERFPHTHDVAAVADPAAWTRSADLSSYTHAYVLGHSHEVDASILAALLPQFDGVVGVIGSQAKKRSLFERLRRAGVPQTRLDRVVMPIGTPIGAEAPEEIAVAVAAEIITTLKASQTRLEELAP